MQRHHIYCEDDRSPGIQHFVQQNGLKKGLALLGAIRLTIRVAPLPVPRVLVPIIKDWFCGQNARK